MLIYAFCNLIGALKLESSFVASDKNVTQNTRPSLYTYVKVAMRLPWKYTSTDCTVHDSVCKNSFSEISLCMLEFSILVKMLHNIFGHNTDYACVVSFAAYLPATVLHDSLKAKLLVKLMWSSETVPQDAHTKFILVLRLLVNI